MDSPPPVLSQVLPCLKTEMPGILSGRQVLLAYLHGSTVDGTALPGSDIDIALVFEEGCNLSSYERMKVEFDIAWEVQQRCEVYEADVRSIDRAPLEVQGRVLTDGLLIYSRDEEFRVEYEVNVRKRYFDFLPVINQMREAFFEHLRTKGVSGGQAR
jgi:predicted nucleotidyltransferase